MEPNKNQNGYNGYTGYMDYSKDPNGVYVPSLNSGFGVPLTSNSGSGNYQGQLNNGQVPTSQTSVPTSQTSPTGEVSFSSAYAPLDSIYNDPTYQGQLDYNKKLAETNVDPETIRTNTIKNFQSEIDALKQVYADKIAEAQTQGLGNLGSARSRQARAGLLGSDFAQGENENINKATTTAVSGIQNEQNLATSAIMDKARAEADTEIERQRAAKAAGGEEYIKMLTEKESNRKNAVARLGQLLYADGKDISKLTPENIAELSKLYNTSAVEIKSAYNAAKSEAEKLALEAKKTQSEINKNERITLSEGEVYIDANGNVIYKNPKTYQPKDESTLTGTGINSALVNQPGYSKLNAKQKTQADSINNLVTALTDYKKEIAAGGTKGGFNLFGKDSALLQTKLNSIIFAAAQAEGTGALQKADRDVIEQIIPNVTSLGGAWNAITKGGLPGVNAKIQDQITKYTSNLAGYGLVPTGNVSANVAANKGVNTSYQPNGTTTVETPDGQVFTFPDEASAEAFKQEAGL